MSRLQLRKANRAHAANVFVPSAASEDTPGTIFSGVYDWWRADYGVTLNGSDVSSWVGQTASNDLAQGTASKQPLFSSGTGPGSQDEIQFTAANSDVLIDNSMAAGIGSGNRVYVFIVGNFTSTGSYYVLDTLKSGGGAMVRLQSIVTGPKLRAQLVLSDGTDTITVNPFGSPTSDHYFEVHNASGGSELLIDATSQAGTLSGTVTAALTDLFLGSTSGGAQFADFNISEMTLVGPSAPSGAEITSWRSYVNTRYGL